MYSLQQADSTDYKGWECYENLTTTGNGALYSFDVRIPVQMPIARSALVSL